MCLNVNPHPSTTIALGRQVVKKLTKLRTYLIFSNSIWHLWVNTTFSFIKVNEQSYFQFVTQCDCSVDPECKPIFIQIIFWDILIMELHCFKLIFFDLNIILFIRCSHSYCFFFFFKMTFQESTLKPESYLLLGFKSLCW